MRTRTSYIKPTYIGPKHRAYRLPYGAFHAATIIGSVVLIAMALVGSWGLLTPELPPCPTEDSSNCYWDAGLHGNGTGQSFVDHDGVVTFTP